MTAASQIKEVLAGCGLIKLLICLCVIVWILTRHTAIEPPKVLHYAANSNISSFYNYSTDTFIFMSIFMMCSVIGFPSSWRKKELNGFKLPHVTVMRFMFNVEFP